MWIKYELHEGHHFEKKRESFTDIDPIWNKSRNLSDSQRGGAGVLLQALIDAITRPTFVTQRHLVIRGRRQNDEQIYRSFDNKFAHLQPPDNIRRPIDV